MYPPIQQMNVSLQRAILAQWKIDQKGFLEEIFSIHWKKYQQEYFSELEVQCSHNLWACKAIRARWKYLHSIWMGRNDQLHKTARILDMEGWKEMINAIHTEYHVELGRLPAYGFYICLRNKQTN